MWRVKVKIPYSSDPLFVEDVPGKTEAEAKENAKMFLKSTRNYDPWDVDAMSFEAVRVLKYDADQVSIWFQTQEE